MSGTYRVIVSCNDEANDRVYRCNKDTTAAEILTRWSSEVEVDVLSVRLRKVNGEHFESTEALFSLESADRMVEVTVDQCCSVRFQLTPAVKNSNIKTLTTSLHARPAELFDSVRDAFKLSSTRPIRFLFRAAPLLNDQTLEMQSVQPHDLLQVELGFKGFVRRLWSGTKSERCFLLFASESAERLTEPLLPAECRISRLGQPFQVHGVVSEVLEAFGNPESLVLELEVQRGISILTDTASKPLAVPTWSTESIGDVLKTLKTKPPPAQPALLTGQLAKHDQSVGDTGLLTEGALLLADSVPISLRCGRRWHVLRLSSHSSVRDLRTAASEALKLPVNGRQKIILRLMDGRVVGMEDDRRLLAQFCIEHGPVFQAEKTLSSMTSAHQLSIQLSNGFEFTIEIGWGEKLRLGDIVSRLAVDSGLERSDLRFRIFACCGCGRRLLSEEEEFQTVPASCCRLRSLHLAEKLYADVGVQSSTRMREKETSTVSGGSNTSESAVQTDSPKTKAKGVGGPVPVKMNTKGTQTAGRYFKQTAPRIAQERDDEESNTRQKKFTTKNDFSEEPNLNENPMSPPEMTLSDEGIESFMPSMTYQQASNSLNNPAVQYPVPQSPNLAASIGNQQCSFYPRVNPAPRFPVPQSPDFSGSMGNQQFSPCFSSAPRFPLPQSPGFSGSMGNQQFSPCFSSAPRFPVPQSPGFSRGTGSGRGSRPPHPHVNPAPRYAPSRGSMGSSHRNRSLSRSGRIPDPQILDRNNYSFFISNLMKGGSDFSCMLQLSSNPSIGDVRRELAAKMTIPVNRLRLRRSCLVEKLTGKRYFRITNGANDPPGRRRFVALDGQHQVIADTPLGMVCEVQTLDDDRAQFGLVPDETLLLEVSAIR